MMEGRTVEHPVVGREAWLAARKALLAREKAFSKARDELAAARRALPWERVEKDYVFETEAGPRRMAELFGGRSQLLVYHFMFGPDWEEGCPNCSYLADHFDGARRHLGARDVELVVVSRAPLKKLLPFKARMGWRFPWVSSHGSDFNFDFGVSFDKAAAAAGPVAYNYGSIEGVDDEMPGLSAFVLGADGGVLHAYSTYARGLDTLVGTYNFLDLAPKGRDEDALPWTMSWVRHHDRYEA